MYEQNIAQITLHDLVLSCLPGAVLVNMSEMTYWSKSTRKQQAHIHTLLETQINHIGRAIH
jgi:hypothetical protein